MSSKRKAVLQLPFFDRRRALSHSKRNFLMREDLSSLESTWIPFALL